MRAAAAAALIVLFGLAAAAPARSESAPEPPLVRSQGVFFEHDVVAGSISIKEKGELRFYALLAGDESGETEVLIASTPGRVSDLVPGAPVVVYWRPDDKYGTRRVAHRLEAPAIPKRFRRHDRRSADRD